MRVYPEELVHGTKRSENSLFNKNLIEADSDSIFLLRKICRSSEAKRLHFATSIGDVNLIKSNLDGGDEINCLDKYGQTALHYAALRNCERSVETLLSRGSRIDLKNNDGDTAFDLAMRNRHNKISEMINQRKLHLDSEFLEAALDSDFEKAKTFLAKGADIDNRDKSGNTVLHHAAANGKVEFVAELLKAGADADAKNKNRDTPLHYATLINCERTVETLLSGGSRINAENKNGNTAFDLARKNNHQKIIEMINQRKLHLNSEFFKAVVVDLDFEKAKTFLAKGADINNRDESGNTVLHHAAANGKVEFVAELLKAGADPNAKNKDLDTPLHYAVIDNNISVVEALLGKVVLCDTDDIAIRFNTNKLNIDAEKRIKAKNKLGETPLDLAKENNGGEIIEIFSKVLQPESFLKKTSARKINGKTNASLCSIQ